MVTYLGTSKDDVINGLSLTADIDRIDGAEGNDTITLRSGQGYIAGAGNNIITGAFAYNYYALWNANQYAVIDLAAGVASNNGFGGRDQISGIETVHIGNMGASINGNKLNETFVILGSNNSIHGNAGYDTAMFYEKQSSNFQVQYIPSDQLFIVTGEGYQTLLYQVEQLTFTDKIIRSADFNGSFVTYSTLKWSHPSESNLTSMKSGDFNGDNIPDLFLLTQVGTGTKQSPFYVYTGDGKGNFSDATGSLFSSSTSLVAGGGRTLIEDFNRDSTTDIFQLGFGNDAPPFPGGFNSIFVSRDGAFKNETVSLIQNQGLNHGGSVGDINNDGYLDVFVNSLSDGDLIYVNDKSGHFLKPIRVDIKTTHTSSGLIDVNGDGWKDAILGSWQKNVDSTVLINKNGTLDASNPLKLPHSPLYTSIEDIVLDVKPIDLNNDGAPELMISVTNGGDYQTFYQIPYIQFLMKSGQAFIDITDQALPGQASETKGWWHQLITRDFNRDGYMDFLAVTAGGNFSSKIYMNQKNGTFSCLMELEPGSRAVAIDATNDGLDDIVTVSEDHISVWKNFLINEHVYKANFGGDELIGSSSIDTFIPSDGNDTLDGGGGLDVIKYSKSSKDYTLQVEPNSVIISDKDAHSTGSDSLKNIERIRFSDTTVALDINENAGQAYRLYQAALDRTPDERGLAGWIKFMDEGGSLTAMSQQFIDSQEFKTKYGALDNSKFVNQLYLNVLDRNGEPAGIAGWVNGLANGLSRAEVLKGFSESSENQANVIGQIKNGIPYVEWWLS